VTLVELSDKEKKIHPKGIASGESYFWSEMLDQELNFDIIEN
jgi:hypothetical protein